MMHVECIHKLVAFVQIKKFVSDFQNGNQLLFRGTKVIWLPHVDGRWLDRDGDIFTRKHGVYFFLFKDNTIGYIGKAHRASLAQRIWSHVGTPSDARTSSATRKGVTIFPNHRFADAPLGQCIAKGDFSVAALSINPSGLAPLMEIAALTFCQNATGLPPLNKQLG